MLSFAKQRLKYTGYQGHCFKVREDCRCGIAPLVCSALSCCRCFVPLTLPSSKAPTHSHTPPSSLCYSLYIFILFSFLRTKCTARYCHVALAIRALSPCSSMQPGICKCMPWLILKEEVEWKDFAIYDTINDVIIGLNIALSFPPCRFQTSFAWRVQA